MATLSMATSIFWISCSQKWSCEHFEYYFYRLDQARMPFLALHPGDITLLFCVIHSSIYYSQVISLLNIVDHFAYDVTPTHTKGRVE